MPLGCWGHGTRVRQLCGPLEPGGSAARLLIVVRRYLCRSCRRVTTVLPGDVTERRWYALWVVVSALASWVCGESLAEVRRRLSPDRTAGPSWPSVWRWAKTLPHPGHADAGGSPLERAAALVQGFAGFAPPQVHYESLIDTAVAGARAVMARGMGPAPPEAPTL